MHRNEADRNEYEAKETRWIFDILKEKGCAKYIIFACTKSPVAMSFLLFFLKSVGIDDDKQAVGQALQSFRDDKDITLEWIRRDESRNEYLHIFWRVKAIRENFVLPELLSSTDTDEERRGQTAARALEVPGMVEGYDGLPAELQKLVANFTLALPIPLPQELPCLPIGHPDSMMSKESVRRAVEDFRVRPSDVIVATFPKTGTTLVTWICHQLRTGGDVDFETLYEVIPWPTLSWDIGYDPNVNGSQFSPRVFKSHLRMASIYRGCKYVVTIRDPAKTALSFYNFFLAKQVPLALEMDVSSFVMETPFVKGREGRASLWEYYQEYHILRDCPSVLVLIYEDLVKDMPSSIRMLAKFMGIEASPELVQKVATMSTKAFMAQHMSKFDEPYDRAKELGRVGDLSQLAAGAKVAVASHPQTFTAAANAFLTTKWQQSMHPLGYANYSAFAAVFRDINQERYGVG
jgi:hypothetical protein